MKGLTAIQTTTLHNKKSQRKHFLPIICCCDASQADKRIGSLKTLSNFQEKTFLEISISFLFNATFVRQAERYYLF